MADAEQLSPLAIREEYIGRVKRMLLGPGSEPRVPEPEREVVAANPAQRYMLGVLYAQGSLQETQEQAETTEGTDEEAAAISETLQESAQEQLTRTQQQELRRAQQEAMRNDGEEQEPELDEVVNMATQYKPSSLGLTCMVKGDPSGANVRVTFGTYGHVEVDQHPETCRIYFQPQAQAFTVPQEFQPYVHWEARTGILSLRQRIPAGTLHAYRQAHKDEAKAEDMADFLWSVWRLSVQQREGRLRTPHTFVVPLDFSQGTIQRVSLREGDADATLMVLRRPLRDDYATLTLMLVNNKHATTALKAEECLFQARLALTATAEDTFRFVDTQLGEPQSADEEEANNALLYRHKQRYATGLGVSVDWEVQDGLGTVRTEFFPQVEVPQMDFTLPPEAPLANADISMKRLSDLDKTATREQKLAALAKLVDYYGTWIAGLEIQAQTELANCYAEAARRNIAHCHTAQQRMREGLQVLRESDVAYHAFELANRAMFMQRVQGRVQGNKVFYPDDYNLHQWLAAHSHMSDYERMPDVDSKGWSAYWRPFQIAFLLMDIPDIVDDAAPRRDTVDLIWFPTGGGKTEAYLGLTAFTICYRRLTHEDAEAAGTAVIMRYTLRLLTTQQFNRASVLICALELMRRQAPGQELGRTPITLGLWIGGGHTPNHTRGDKSAQTAVEAMAQVKGVGDLKTVKNPFQVLKCPWCGTSLTKHAIVPPGKKNRKLVGTWGYHMSGGHFALACTQPGCPFYHSPAGQQPDVGQGDSYLPLQVVDDELYQAPPTLLFATVDKFAMMAWKGAEIAHFFGLDDAQRRAPELIIQDELHLISGALGTMVGLYETAVDFACQQKGVKPKIVAATATVCKAKEQCAELYNRAVFQFPPSGLDAENSFFAREKPVDHATAQRFGRKYIGLMPAGKTKSVAEIRHMAVLLELTRSLSDLGLSEQQMDMLWTLTVYFGSLRNLGHAQSQVSDEVQSMVERIAKYLPARIRSVPYASELTSRIATPRLVETLAQLEKVTYNAQPQNGKWATNLLLATNMISVGIDVPRLNQMLVIGQPKMTSEYIQSTSRIGRNLPGVAFVSYNPTNSRDRSHYEQFKAFHQAFYRQVEPCVVTPFSLQALKRALPAVVLSMMWLSAADVFVDTQQAGLFNLQEPQWQQKAAACKAFIQQRVRGALARSQTVAQAEAESEVAALGRQIDQIFSRWSNEAEQAKAAGWSLWFGKASPVWMMGRHFSLENTQLLQLTYEQDLCWHEQLADNQRQGWLSMTSMRNVDEELAGKLIFYQED